MFRWRMEDVYVEDGIFSSGGNKMFRWRMENVQVEDVTVQIEDGSCLDENGRCLGVYDGCSGGGCKMYNWKIYIFWWMTQDVVQVKDERFFTEDV
jgi:hypothetical protein